MDSTFDQLNSQIKTLLPWALSNYNLNEESALKSKKLLHGLIHQLEDPKLSIQRLYLIYTICEKLFDDEDNAVNFFRTLFPVPLRKNVASFIKQLVSLAIALDNKAILTASTIYLDKEQIKLTEDDIEQLPLNLAESSPSFAAVLIDKGFFNLVSSPSSNSPDMKTNLLTRWLMSLNECKKKITFNGQALLRYSLLGQGQGNSELHFYILESIQNKRLQQLSNQFVIDMATQLSQRNKDDLISKFAHVLIIGVKNGICNTLVSSNQMRNNLKTQFPNNLLIRALVNMKQK